MKRPDPEAPYHPLVVAAPTPCDATKAANLPLLPDRSEQIAAVLSQAPEGARSFLSGDGATLAALADQVAGASSVTFFVHGLYDPKRLQPSGFALAEGEQNAGDVWAQDLAAVQAPPFVSLFTCYAGADFSRRGAERAGHLGESFLAAGAKSVLLSKAPLSYDASLELAADLQRELARGSSPSKALREARRRCVERSPERQAVHAFLPRVHGFGFD